MEDDSTAVVEDQAGGGAVGYDAAPPTSSMAVLSLILGILGWVALPLIGSILAVVFGHVALGEIDRSRGRLGGRGMAQVGLVLGYAALGLEVLGVVFFVVLPVLGCGFCSICGAVGSSFGAGA
jgi:hypothetical protein